MARGSCSPTNIPVKPKKPYIPHGNVYQRVTENKASPRPPKRDTTILPIEFEEDYTAEILCAYNIGRQNGIYGGSLIKHIAGVVGCFESKVRKALTGKSLGKG